MTPSDTRVTARIVRTVNGKNHTEYRVGDLAVGSLEALEVILNAR